MDLMTMRQSKQTGYLIRKHGGKTRYVVKRSTDFLLCAAYEFAERSRDCARVKKALQLAVPVVARRFIQACVDANGLVDHKVRQVC